MAISVSVANPGRISSVGNASPGRISSVGVANPGRITSVGVAQPTGRVTVGGPAPRAASTGPAAVYRGNTGGGAPAPVYAPKLDVAAINAQARQAAENAVNPYYTKVLSEFLAQQAAQRARAQTQFQTDITDMEDTLKETLEGNALNRTRTAEDVDRNQQGINQTADEFQVDSGEQFTADRIMQARELAASGKTGGLAAQEAQKTQDKRNTVESRQATKFQEQKDLQELFKTRTFADLLKSDELATTKTEKGKKQRQFDLDSYIESSNFEEQNRRNELERQRLGDIQQNQAAQSKLLFNNYLAKITNPAQYEAAVRTYGGLF